MDADSAGEPYGPEYYRTHCGPMPYERNAHWLWFFGRMADELIRGFAPRRVFDAGCAMGLLVESFWDRGVEAHGRDVSVYALSQARADIRQYCQQGSIADPLIAGGEVQYDLVTCIEVLEHMPPEAAYGAIAAMTQAAPRIVFSSSPTDLAEPTHINVRPTLYWLQLFAEFGFLPCARYDAGFITSHAFVLERAQAGAEKFDLAAFAELIRQRQLAEQRAAALAECEQHLAKLQATMAQFAAERHDIDALAERAAQAEASARRAASECEAALKLRDRVLKSTTWRLTWPVRAAGEMLKLPWRGNEPPPASPPPDAAITPPPALPPKPAAADLSATAALAERFAALQPLAGFTVDAIAPRVTVVTDSINPDSLFGGVATAIILAALLARRRGASLRLVTRTEPHRADVLRDILDLHGITFEGNIDVLTSDLGPSCRLVPISPDDVFLTTSWWSTWSTRRTVPAAQILYLLQEDERMFYPRGDDSLRCTELLSDPSLRFIINSQLLFEHFGSGPNAIPNIATHGVWFEPAFPAQSPPIAKPAEQKRDFLFYARPGNPRNLFWRGLETIIAALDAGVFHPDRWNLHFVGRDLAPFVLPHATIPILHQNLPWADYAALVAKIDVGLSLMYTPHPSYPPLDMAASGAVVVTSQCDGKTTLSRYSRNILCVPPTVEALTAALAAAVRLADDTPARLANHAATCLSRDWQRSFAPVLDRFCAMEAL
jgi:SAM-dependent methyltransferase